MPRPATDAFWVQRLAIHAEEGLKSPAIYQALLREAHALQRTDAPSEATVGRLFRKWKQQPLDARRQQNRFRWPDSMEEGALPWSASRAALDLLRYRDQCGVGRPTVSEARWFWRLRLATPTLPDDDADHFARLLAFQEFARAAELPANIESPDLEWRLAYEPWTDDTHAGTYQQAARRLGLPAYPSSVTRGWFGDERAQRAYNEWVHGGDTMD